VKFNAEFQRLAQNHNLKYVPACRSASAWLMNEANDRVVAVVNDKLVGWYKSSPHIPIWRREILAFLKDQ
jgi:hypothetical protein